MIIGSSIVTDIPYQYKMLITWITGGRGSSENSLFNFSINLSLLKYYYSFEILFI